MKVRDISESPAWVALSERCELLRQVSLRDLYARDPQRNTWAYVEAAGLLLDFSRQLIDAEALAGLTRVADELGLAERRDAMFRGECINVTERRPALHTALRARQGPFHETVIAERRRMLDFAEAVRRGDVLGSTNLPFELVVNIGIGGSDLGPAMAVQALRQYLGSGPRVEFVSNVDGCRLTDLLAGADPGRTLFLVCSKTFTTAETLSNAGLARKWLTAQLSAEAVPAHFAAVSVNDAAMDEFGIHRDHRFAMWDWVGGRYSMWSSVGISLAIAVGAAHFEDFLRGGQAIDDHFREAEWGRNLPVIMGLIGALNINGFGLPTLAVLPYDDRLARFPAYLQQLEMESNGKAVRMDGSPVRVQTAPVVWGEAGSNAQHSFFQMLHQGELRAALDFLLPLESSCNQCESQKLVIANCLGQVEAFAYGQPAEMVEGPADLVPHKVHPGGRPSSLLMYRRTDPFTLGALVAVYEHKVFVQSVLWGINAFDQWGVELGKQLAKRILPILDEPHRASTPSLRASLAAAQRLMS